MPFRESIKQLAKKMQTCEEWLELVRDLQDPIETGSLPAELRMRWADKGDLMAINALQGFVKETDFMEASLRKGDRCLVLEHDGRICAFAWVTFSDYRRHSRGDVIGAFSGPSITGRPVFPATARSMPSKSHR